MGDRYEPVDIDELAEDVLQGYSAALHLHLRWERGQLGLHVPETGLHIATFASERAARIQAEARADQERAARLQAEAQMREMEEELRRLRGD